MPAKKILYLGLDPSRFQHDGELIHIPVIKIVSRPFDTLKEAFGKLAECTHVLFTSRSAVALYKEYGLKIGADLKNKIYISSGSATSQKMAENGFQATHCADEETAEGIIALIERLKGNFHLFFPRSAQGRSLIVDYLKEKNIDFTCVDLYDTVPNAVTLPEIESFDEIIFTSPSHRLCLSRTCQKASSIKKCRAIGPITEQALATFFDSGKAKPFKRFCRKLARTPFFIGNVTHFDLRISARSKT